MPVSLPNDKTVASKADRDLLRRVVVSLESNREVDLDTLLQRELSLVPLSIATFDGSLRLASSQSDFFNILQKHVFNILQKHVQPPISHHHTCTIIDGMKSRCQPFMFPMVVVQPASLRVSVIKESALKIFDSLPKLIAHQGEYCPPEESVWADAKTFVFKLYNHGTDGVDIDKAKKEP